VTPLTTREIEELLGAYALDAVDGDEARQIEEHLVDCPRCRAELDDHRAVAALVANTGESAPDGLWARIAESLEEPPPALRLSLAPMPSEALPGVVPISSRLRPATRWLVGAAAAAVVVIAGLAALVVHQNRRLDHMQGQVAAQRSLDGIVVGAMGDRSNRVMTLTSPTGAEMSATAVMTEQGTGYLVTTSMPALDGDRTYQLWGLEGAKVISLGVLGGQPQVAAFPITDGLTGLVITEEVSGGVTSSTNAPLLMTKWA
jgi:hypothetical protein